MPKPMSGCPQCAEFAKVVAELQTQIKELRSEVRELKARLNTHSGNSSLPPSANPPSAPPPPPKAPTGRRPGGQPGHEGHVRVRLPPERVKQVIPYVPQTCERCRAALPAQAGPDDPAPVWHQVAELPALAAEITEHQAHGRRCAGCGHVTWAPLPAAVLAHGFGPRLASAVVFLNARCQGSKRLVAEIVQTLFGVPISGGSICNIATEASAALAGAHVQAGQAVRQAPVKNVDETGWSLAGKLCWLWMAATQSVAYFKICAGRGRAQFQELLGENLLGILCTDRWGAYNAVALAWRQLCWAHLKRDFQKCLDRGGAAQVIGRAGLDAVSRVFALWRDFRQGLIDRAELQTKLAPVCATLRAALVAGQDSPDKQVRRFCRKLLAAYRALWTFALLEGVEPTNNHAERTLRMAVLWRKISFGNHSEGGCRFTERLLTVIQTLRLQKRNVMAYLEQVMVAARADQVIPPLILG